MELIGQLMLLMPILLAILVGFYMCGKDFLKPFLLGVLGGCWYLVAFYLLANN